ARAVAAHRVAGAGDDEARLAVLIAAIRQDPVVGPGDVDPDADVLLDRVLIDLGTGRRDLDAVAQAEPHPVLLDLLRAAFNDDADHVLFDGVLRHAHGLAARVGVEAADANSDPWCRGGALRRGEQDDGVVAAQIDADAVAVGRDALDVTRAL